MLGDKFNKYLTQHDVHGHAVVLACGAVIDKHAPREDLLQLVQTYVHFILSIK